MEVDRSAYEQLSQVGLHIGGEVRTLGVGRLLWEKPIRLFEYTSLHGNCAIGAYTFVNKGFNVASIEIGRYCAMASYIREVGDHDKAALSTHPLFTDRGDDLFPGDPTYAQILRTRRPDHPQALGVRGPIRIGHDVWIGEGVLLKSGVRIGNGAVVGANSFVRDDVPPYAVMVGCPGKVRKMRFDDKVIERLERLRWWDYNPADFSNHINFRDVEASLDFIEEGIGSARIRRLQPERYLMEGGMEGGRPRMNVSRVA